MDEGAQPKEGFPPPKNHGNVQTNPFLIRPLCKYRVCMHGKRLMQKNTGGTEVKPWLPLLHILLSHAAGTCASGAGPMERLGGMCVPQALPLRNCCPQAKEGWWGGGSRRLKGVTQRTAQGRIVRELRASQQGMAWLIQLKAVWPSSETWTG